MLFRSGRTWRYFPVRGNPVDLIDNNLLQIMSMPTGRDRFRGLGYCTMSRLLDAKQLMVGYLTYYRQEIGQLPAELVAIINGLDATTVEDSLRKYKVDKEAAGLDTYGKVWWIGSDDPATRVTLDIHSLTVPNKSFNWQQMVEWWIKVLALNTGEDVGEYWLLQNASGLGEKVTSVQAAASRGKGFAKFCKDYSRGLNVRVFPPSTHFEFDNTDDEQDMAHADLVSKYVGTLKTMAETVVGGQQAGGMGAQPAMPAQQSPLQVSPELQSYLGNDEEQQPMEMTPEIQQQFGSQYKQYEDFDYAADSGSSQPANSISGVDAQQPQENPNLLFTREELRQLAVEWNIITPEMNDEDAPTIIGAMLKEASRDEDVYEIDSRGRGKMVRPLLKGREAHEALEVLHAFKEVFGVRV